VSSIIALGGGSAKKRGAAQNQNISTPAQRTPCIHFIFGVSECVFSERVIRFWSFWEAAGKFAAGPVTRAEKSRLKGSVFLSPRRPLLIYGFLNARLDACTDPRCSRLRKKANAGPLGH